MKYEELLKNSHAYSIVRNDILKNNLGHAYMLVSSDTEVLEELAMLIACTIYCKDDGCLVCNTCKKILDDNHSDIKHIKKLPDKKYISVDQVEKLIESSILTSYENDVKLYIIHDADALYPSAQNKLLKTLEEPNPDVCIILLVSNPALLLDTIKSRVRNINLDYFNDDQIISVLEGDEDKLSIAVNCADGSIGKAFSILNNDKYIEQFKVMLNVFAKLENSKKIAELVTEDVFSKERIVESLNILDIIVRDAILVKLNSKKVFIVSEQQDEIERIANNYSVEALTLIVYAIIDSRKRLDANCNVANVVSNLLFKCLEVKYKCQ